MRFRKLLNSLCDLDYSSFKVFLLQLMKKCHMFSLKSNEIVAKRK